MLIRLRLKKKQKNSKQNKFTLETGPREYRILPDAEMQKQNEYMTKVRAITLGKKEGTGETAPSRRESGDTCCRLASGILCVWQLKS